MLEVAHAELVLGYGNPAPLGSEIFPGQAVQRKPASWSLWDLDAGMRLAMTYSHTAFRRTTIGAGAFHFRVRDGIGWDHAAMITRSPPAFFSRTRF